jgi:hypothetical protein
MKIVGSRGLTGKKTKNASGQFTTLFDEVAMEAVEADAIEEKEEVENITEEQYTSLFS